jgi:hypothetical protein
LSREDAKARREKLGQGQLQLDGFAQSIQIRGIESADSRLQTAFAHRRELIRHCLSLLTIQRDVGFARVKARDVAR